MYGDGDSVRIAQSSLTFKYEELRKATSYFDPANKLGQGSYGAVYKAVLPDGKEVAVKKLFLNTREWIDQFFNEVELISQVRHKNLVKLLGCSVNGPESLLVYEYYFNKSLHLFLFDANRSRNLTWDLRVDIIQGIAEGLSYLHEESETRIIHRDIKAGNILLDDKFKPKITDFGLARAFAEDRTHLTTGVAGTIGYMAPEYVVHGHLTEKADVYSYGILVLEVVTGKRHSGSIGSHGGQVLLMKYNSIGITQYLEDIIINIQRQGVNILGSTQNTVNSFDNIITFIQYIDIDYVVKTGEVTRRIVRWKAKPLKEKHWCAMQFSKAVLRVREKNRQHEVSENCENAREEINNIKVSENCENALEIWIKLQAK